MIIIFRTLLFVTGIRSDMSDARYGSSFNSSYSSDVPMTTTTNYRSEPKYIKKPNPPPKMIAELDASPGTTSRYKIRNDQRLLTTDNNRQYDINKNDLDKYHHPNHHPKHRYNKDSPSCRRLPKQPKEVQLIDKTLLRDSFNTKNNRKHNQQQTIDTVTTPMSKTRRSSNKDTFLYMVESDSDSSCSTDSAQGSDRSISTVSSLSISRHNHHHHHSKQQNKQHQQQIHKISSPYKGPVPKNNFIPGQTRRLTSSKQHASSTAAAPTTAKGRKVSFCFRGVSFRVYNNTPRTYRALAHAGCIALIIPSPENHKCKV